MARPARNQRFDLTQDPLARTGNSLATPIPLIPLQLRLEHLIYRGQKTEIHGATGEGGAPLIVKLLRRGEQTVSNLTQLRREFEFLRMLPHAAVRRATGLFEIDGVAALVLEGIEAITMHEHCRARLSLARRVRLAARWARALAQIHVKGIVHRDVNPSNVLVTPGDDRVFLIDFGIAVQLTRSQAALPPSTTLDGTMPYLAPEQTGRTAHALDERCDLYGLGASLYEMFTGTPPFPGKDGIELIHAHLTQKPKAPHEQNPEVPPCLSRLVLKLLAKDPAARYRGALGVACDLEAIESLLEKGDKSALESLESLELGRFDMPLRLAIPRRLYGRASQAKRLRDEWDYVLAGGSALVLLRGPAGSGKTALLRSLASSDLYRNAHVAAGKYELLGRDTPYDGFIQAGLALIHGMEASHDTERQRWRERLTAALGVNAAALTDLIPELAEVIGPAPMPLPEATPVAAKNRLHQTFLKFFSTFAEATRPLVLFLDDIQWADGASLELITQIAGDPHGHVLLVTACRDEELATKPALSAQLALWEREMARFCAIELTPVDEAAVVELCCETLHWSQAEATSLAAALHQRSHGNPFFVNQLLQGLYRDELLTFELDTQRWEVDFRRLHLLPQSEQVTSLLTARLRDMPEAVQNVLSCAAFYGHKFDAQILAVAMLIPLDDVEEALALAVSEELILRSGGDDQAERGVSGSAGYQFLHDRVVEACQGLLAPAAALAQQIALARILVGDCTTLKGLTPSAAAPIFHALYHFTAASILVTESDERLRLARLYADAGERAQAATAWDIGAELFRQGSSFLPESRGRDERALQRRLQYGEGSCAMLAGATKTAEQRFAALLADAATPREVAEVQYVRCRLYTSMERNRDGVAAGMAGLRALGIGASNFWLYKMRAFPQAILLQHRIGKMDRDEILSLQAITDSDALLAIALFTETIHPCFLTDSELGVTLACLLIEFILKHGHSPQSATPFLYLAVSITGISATLATAVWSRDSVRKILEIYRRLAEGTPEDDRRLQSELVYRAYCSHWMPNLRESAAGLFPLASRFIERGDMTFAGYAMMYAPNMAMYLGQNLISIQSHLTTWTELLPKQSDAVRMSLSVVLNSQRQLIDGDKQTTLASVMAPDADAYTGPDQGVFYTGLLEVRGIIMILFGEFAAGHAVLSKAIGGKILRFYAGNYKNITMCFFFALSIASQFSASPLWKRPWLLVQLAWVRHLLRVFTRMSPEFTRHKLTFANALWRIVLGKHPDRTEALLESALQLAQRENASLDEGVIAEYTGRWLLGKNSARLATGPLLTASAAFERCGMLAKVREVEELIKNLPAETLRPEQLRTSSTMTTASKSSQESSTLDAPTLIRAAYTLSREINLTDLKTTLLQLLVETAGARHATLLWRPKDTSASVGSMQVVAHRTAAGVITVDALPASDELASLRVLGYVERTRKALILGDVSSDINWQEDPALIARQVKSLLCIPIMVGGAQNGAIYLENDLLSHSFTADRVKTLTVLAGQLAISLDNAMLYTKLSESLAAERTARAQEQQSHAAYIAAEEARRHLQAGLEAAEAVQKSLVSVKPASPAYEIDYLYVPAENTGGDWLSSYVDERHGWLYLCLGDVTGHGVPAALVTAAVAGAIASWVTRLTQSDVDLPEAISTVATAVNTAVLATGGPTEQLMTLALIGLNLETGEVSYLNAGHHPFLWIGTSTEIVLQRGNPLGHSSSEIFGRRNLTLSPGDMLVLYSDGLVENRDAQGERLSMRTLKRIVTAAGSPKDVIAQMRAYVTRLPQDADRDDTACLAIKWLGPGPIKES